MASCEQPPQPLAELTYEPISNESLFLDFEQELADLLRRPRHSVTSVTSGSTSPVTSGRVRTRSIADAVEYESDGTIVCSNLNYDVLVMEILMRGIFALVGTKNTDLHLRIYLHKKTKPYALRGKSCITNHRVGILVVRKKVLRPGQKGDTH